MKNQQRFFPGAFMLFLAVSLSGVKAQTITDSTFNVRKFGISFHYLPGCTVTDKSADERLKVIATIDGYDIIMTDIPNTSVSELATNIHRYLDKHKDTGTTDHVLADMVTTEAAPGKICYISEVYDKDNKKMSRDIMLLDFPFMHYYTGIKLVAEMPCKKKLQPLVLRHMYYMLGSFRKI